MSDPPVEWLRPLIEARKATAEAAAYRGVTVWHARQHPADNGIVVDDGGEIVVYDEGEPTLKQAMHIALNDPRQIIADCDKDLAILDQHPPGSWVGDDEDRWQRCGGEDWVQYPCRTVRLIGRAYRHRDPAGYAEVAGGWTP